MAGEPFTIQIDPTSELARALVGADEPVVLDSNGVRYRVLREQDALFESYDPSRVREALRKSAGALGGVNVTTLKRELRAQREQDSEGRPA